MLAMTRADLDATALAWLSLWTAPLDAARFLSLHAPDFVDHSPGPRPPTREGFLEGLRDFFALLPRAVTTAEDLVIDVERQRVAIRWRAKSFTTTVTGIELITLREGLVTERWGEWDDSSLRR